MDDTILALSSPPSGNAPRAILRLSGPASWPLTRHLLAADLRLAWQPVLLTALHLHLPAAILAFRAPRSFTGEDLIELHLPNSPALLALLTDHLLDLARRHNLPARLANPGEFTARAFFNAKLDLTEAEGIAATIAAASQTELRAAARLLQGDLHRWISALARQLADTLALVEAGIDFADENLDLLPPAQLRQTLQQLHTQIHDQLAQALRIDRLAELPTIVFIGRPNVGKSSLINALSQSDRSIVSPIAGTTRDVLSAIMHISPSPQNDHPPFSGGASHRQIRLLDVPGEETPTTDLQSQMMATRQAALLDADLIVEVLDDPTSASTPPDDPAPRLVIYNKSDLHPIPPNTPLWQHVSATRGTHIPELRAHLAHLLAPHPTVAASRIVLNHRHRELLAQAAARLTAAQSLDPAAQPELLAAELRRALDLLGQITGTISPDEVLSRIFSQFCIGK
jgi:tRNA modification GTPase